MIGYRTNRYREFGWASARFDDLLNWLPSRISAVLLLWSQGNIRLKGWKKVTFDAKNHISPNAGWPEASMAYILEIALAGPRSYGGQSHNFSWINESGKQNATPADIDSAVNILWLSWFMVLSFSISLTILNIINQ